MSIPDWWEFLLLGLAAYRAWRLLAQDDILDGPRNRVLGLPWGYNPGEPIPRRYREGWAQFLVCPWCSGAWVAIAWWGSWEIWEHGTLVVATPFAISAVVGFLRGNLDPPEE